MKRLKRVLVWIVVIAFVFIAIAFLLPKNVFVVRSKTIEASPKTVFNQIVDLHQWNKWSTWNRIDPDMKIEYFNNGVGLNAGYQWESENKQVGNGSLKIIEVAKYDSIVVNLNFMQKGVARSVFYLKETNNGTLVKWTLQNDLGNNPFSRWMGLLMDKFVGTDFEEGLMNLNALCRDLEDEKSYIVELIELNEFTFASVRMKVAFNEISLMMGEMYGQIGAFLESNDIEMAGMPYAIYHLMDGQEIDLECGIPITKIVEGNETIKTGVYTTKLCATVDYFGDYYQLELGHNAVQEWMGRHGFNLVGAPMEIYVSDPGLEPNPENWLTQIYYPID